MVVEGPSRPNVRRSPAAEWRAAAVGCSALLNSFAVRATKLPRKFGLAALNPSAEASDIRAGLRIALSGRNDKAQPTREGDQSETAQHQREPAPIS